MGTWGTGPFDDDNASDWVWELQEASDWSVVEDALKAAVDVESAAYLEAPDGQVAWAAATVVAAADAPGLTVPDEVRIWVDAHKDSQPAGLRTLGAAALRRVLADNSELVELWQAAGEEREWRSNVQGVTTALA
jgi:hypothetical protein